MNLSRVPILAFITLAALAQVAAPDRKVERNLVVSDHDPKVRIELPSSVQYLGADRFVLYGIADCELHAFVEVNAAHAVEHLYWVQFEQYLPTRPDLHHKYDSPQHTKMGGWDFYVDFWPRAADEEVTPGSDREHIEALIRGKSDHIPQSMMYVRLVHLLDPAERKELMIIYGEDLAPFGLSAADLKPGGKAYGRWPELENGLLKRAEKQIKVEPLQ